MVHPYKQLEYWHYALALFLLAFLCHGIGLQNEFVWDDLSLVVNNPLIVSVDNLWKVFSEPIFSGIGNYYRPMMAATYILDYQLWGLNPAGFHFTNIILHVFVSIGLFNLFLQHFSRKTAFICTAIYIVHPLNVSNVAAIACRNGILECMLFWSLYFQNKYFTNKKIKDAALTCFCFLIALFSRESAMLFPLLSVAYALCFFPNYIRNKKSLFYLVIIFLILALYIAGRFLWMPFAELRILSPIASESLLVRFWTGLSTIPFYISIFLFPIYLYNERHFIYSSVFDPMPWLSIFLIFLLFCLAFRQRKKNIYIGFGIFWMLVCIGPTMNIIPLNSTMEEHWFTFSAVGLYFILGKFIDSFSFNKKLISITIFSVFFCFFIVRSIARTMDWKDNFTYFQQELKYAPDSYIFQTNLGVEYAKKNQIGLAKSYFEEAIRLEPRYSLAHSNLGVMHERENNLVEAERSYRRAINGTKTASSYSNLAAVLYKTNRIEEAKILILEGRRYFPSDPNLAAAEATVFGY